MVRAFNLSRIAVVSSLLTLAPAAGFGARPQVPAATVDVESLGPRVGDPLPDFNLPDQAGHVQPLKSLLGPKGAVIVFFRSADW
jgi:hypothetical protein